MTSSLQQGKIALSYTQEYLKDVPARLQISSSPAWQAFNESMQDLTNQKDVKVNVTENERAFNHTLLKYSNLHQLYMEQILHTPRTPESKLFQKQMLAELNDLNARLISYANAINMELAHATQNLADSDRKLKDELDVQQGELHVYIKALKEAQRELTTLNGAAETSALVSKSNYMQFIVWFLLGFTLMGLSIFYVQSDNDVNILVVMLLLMTIFILAKWVL